MLENYKYKACRPHVVPPTNEQFKNFVLSDSIDDPNRRSLVPSEGARSHYPPLYSMPFEQKIKARLSQPASKEWVERGKKSIKPIKHDDEPRREGVKYFPEQSTKRSEQGETLDLGKKRVVMNEELEIPCARVRGGAQYDMEGYMNRKQRINTIERLRNGIPVRASGDKYYYDADREPGFYAKGGIIPGSSIQLRKSARPELRKGEETNVKVKKCEETYAEKVKRLALEYEVNQVNTLTQATTKLGAAVPSWESRTGNFLVAPENEDD